MKLATNRSEQIKGFWANQSYPAVFDFVLYFARAAALRTLISYQDLNCLSVI
jgi:hypothetical protein